MALKSYDPARSAALQSEVSQYRARRQKADRRLARDIAKWVDSALGGMAAAGGQGGSGGGDLQVLDDEGDDQQGARHVEGSRQSGK